MASRQSSCPTFHCLRCLHTFDIPRRAYCGPQCPRCYDKGLFFGTWESFMRIYAGAARAALPEEVGGMVAKLLRNNRN